MQLHTYECNWNATSTIYAGFVSLEPACIIGSNSFLNRTAVDLGTRLKSETCQKQICVDEHSWQFPPGARYSIKMAPFVDTKPEYSSNLGEITLESVVTHHHVNKLELQYIIVLYSSTSKGVQETIAEQNSCYLVLLSNDVQSGHLQERQWKGFCHEVNRPSQENLGSESVKLLQ